MMKVACKYKCIPLYLPSLMVFKIAHFAYMKSVTNFFIVQVLTANMSTEFVDIATIIEFFVFRLRILLYLGL